MGEGGRGGSCDPPLSLLDPPTTNQTASGSQKLSEIFRVLGVNLSRSHALTHCRNETSNPKETTMIDRIIAFENGELSHEEIVDLFEALIDTGTIHHLQGHYGRVAQDLIDSGEIVR